MVVVVVVDDDDGVRQGNKHFESAACRTHRQGETAFIAAAGQPAPFGLLLMPFLPGAVVCQSCRATAIRRRMNRWTPNASTVGWLGVHK